MRLRDWSEGRAPEPGRECRGGGPRYISRPPGRGAERVLRRLLLVLLLQLLLQLPFLDPQSAPAHGVVRQRRGSLAAPQPVPPDRRRAAHPRPKLPCTAGWASSGCSGPAGGAHRNSEEASGSSSSGDRNDSVARARRAPGQLELGGLGCRGVHVLAQPPPGLLLQL